MKQLLIYSLLVVLLYACSSQRPPDNKSVVDPSTTSEPDTKSDLAEEAITYGKYLVDNQTNDTLYIKVTSSDRLQLVTNKVLPKSKAHIYSPVEGTGGHVKPSNFFETFTVTAQHNSQKKVVYQGVNNNDWQQVAPEGKTQVYQLTIK